MQQSDEQFIDRFLAGDKAAFDGLHAAHANYVLGHLLRCGFSRFDAEDLSQEIFLRVTKSLGTFDGQRGKFRQWLGAITRNVARREWARRRDADRFDVELAGEMLAAPMAASHGDTVQEEMAFLSASVSALNDELRRVIHLRYVEGLTTRAMAADLDMPESTVRLRLGEAQAAIAAALRARGLLA